MLNKQQIAGMSIFVNDPPLLVSGNARNAVEFTLQTSLQYYELDQISQKFVNRMKKDPVFINRLLSKLDNDVEWCYKYLI